MRAKQISVRPFTEEEKRFAETNHDVVYRFLNMGRYDIEEYYNVVIMDYLQVVQKWFERPELRQKCSFATLAFYGMRRAIFNHKRANGKDKRKMEVEAISIEMGMTADGKSLVEVVPDPAMSALENIIRMENDMEYLMEILALTTEIQTAIILGILDGYKERELYRKIGIKCKEYRSELENIREILMEQMIGKKQEYIYTGNESIFNGRPCYIIGRSKGGQYGVEIDDNGNIIPLVAPPMWKIKFPDFGGKEYIARREDLKLKG